MQSHTVNWNQSELTLDIEFLYNKWVVYLIRIQFIIDELLCKERYVTTGSYGNIQLNNCPRFVLKFMHWTDILHYNVRQSFSRVFGSVSSCNVQSDVSVPVQVFVSASWSSPVSNNTQSVLKQRQMLGLFGVSQSLHVTLAVRWR